MHTKNMNSEVNCFFEKDSKWKNEYLRLRQVVLGCNLKEELKWGVPCYTFQDKNVVLIHGFKDYCALLFHKGSLLKDDAGMLIQQTKNVQSARQLRFKNLEEIKNREKAITAYIEEAIGIEKSGKKVKFKETKDYPVPEEFRDKLEADPGLERAFYALSPGRQRAYLYYFSQAKRSETRASRVEKCLPKILEGKGKDD